VGHARCATPDRRLLGRLDPFGAGEQPTGRDAVSDERTVVGAAREVSALEGDVARLKEPLERLFELRRTCRARAGPLGIRIVAVIDEEHMVRTADHVEVEVQRDPSKLYLR